MVEAMWTGIAAIFIGIVVGYGARLILPGRQRISAMATMFIGFMAALIGGAVAHGLGLVDTDGISWIRLIFQLGLAVIMVGVYSGWFFTTHRD